MTRIEEIEQQFGYALALTGGDIARLSVPPTDLRYLLDFAKAAKAELEKAIQTGEHAETCPGSHPAYCNCWVIGARQALALLEAP